MDIWYGFACHGIDFLADNGVLCFIAQNNWTTSAGAKKMRVKVMTDTRILQLVDFNDYMVFEDSASIQTMVMLFQKDCISDNYYCIIKSLNKNSKRLDLLDLLVNKHTTKTSYLNPIIVRNKMINKLLTFSKNEELLWKVAKDKLFLYDSEATNGIHPHYDFVNNKIARNHIGAIVGEGIFGLSNLEKSNLNLMQREKELIKPYYTTDQVHRYYTNNKNLLWIIYTNSSFKRLNSMDNYPNLKRHLDRFRHIISSDNKPYGLHRAREEKFFNGEKIVVQRKCVGRPSFSYSDFDCYVSATFYIIKTNRWNLKFLTGLLNSKLITFWLRHKGKMQGENFQVDKEPLLNIPLPITDVSQQPIITLVNQILDAKQENPNADTSEWENEIDQLVYQLYELTDEEIAIVEQ